MLRSILALIAGFLVTAIIVMATTALAAMAFGLPMISTSEAMTEGPTVTPSTGYLVTNLVCSALAAIVGGWTAAIVGRRHPMGHAGGLAALLAIGGAVGVAWPQPGQPTWYPASLLVIGPVGALIGGFLRQLRDARMPTSRIAP
jgi:hypothetical protein